MLKAPIKDYAVLTVTRGGLIPAGLLAYKLGIRSFETVNVRSYLDKKRGNFEILNPINETIIHKKDVIIIDDLSDTGQTFEQLREFFPNAVTACLYAKPLGEKVTDVFARSIPQDTWITFPWDTDNGSNSSS